MGKIKAISISKKKGTKKTNVPRVMLKKDFGIVGDAHAGVEKRQVSFLAAESIEKMKAKGLDVKPGGFAENITTEGINLLNLKIGDKIKINTDVILEISQIGKDCHSRCAIYYQAGDCIMPREGIFAKVLKGGIIRTGDRLEVVRHAKQTK
jgi:MOSC domain-containing protein YiiM